jgi:hypothetical protein
MSTIPKEKIIIYDAINGDFYEVDNFEEALEGIKEVATDPEEGIHPDIESIKIYKEIADVVCEQVEGKEAYKVKIIPRQLATDGREELEKENKDLRDKHYRTMSALQSSLKEKEKECEELKAEISRIVYISQQPGGYHP